MADIVKTVKLSDAINIPPLPLPQALTGLILTAFNTTTLQVGWTDPGQFAQSYQIDVSTNVGFTAIVASTTVNAVTPMAGGFTLVAGLNLKTSNHYVRIRAVNSTGASAYATATFNIPYPDAVTTLSAIPVSSSQINLSWVDPGEWAVQYEVQYDTAVAFTSPVISYQPANPLGSAIKNLTGLAAATLYYIRVRAINGPLGSAWTSTSQSTL